MLAVILNNDIEYTKGDTFKLNITSDIGFEANTQLEFTITTNQNTEPIIKNKYNLNLYNEFDVTLTVSDIEKLNFADYMYRLTVYSPEGEIITHKSGNFKVKWGA